MQALVHAGPHDCIRGGIHGSRCRPASADKGKKSPVSDKNKSRSVRRCFRSRFGTKLYPAYVANCPQWDCKKKRRQDRKLAFLPPHETLAAITDDDNRDAFTSFSPEQRRFRQDLESWAASMMVHLVGAWACLALWGDMAPHTKTDSIFLLTWALMNGQCRQRFWLTCLSKSRVCKCGCKGRHSFNLIFSVVAWSVRALQAGTWPAFNHLGQRFRFGDWRRKMSGNPIGLCGTVLRKFGDWEWMKNGLGLRGWQGETSRKLICMFCAASKLYDPWAYDPSLEAGWRSTITSEPEFWSQNVSSKSYVSPLWLIPGFRLEWVKADWMHVFCLGILPICVGNCVLPLWERLGGSRKTPVPACSLLHNLIALAARDLGVPTPFRFLTLGMFSPKPRSKPRMRLKAAEARAFAPVLLHVMATFFPSSPEHTLRMQCLGALVSMYKELDNWQPSGVSRHLVSVLIRRHITLFGMLREMMPADSPRWCFVPKHHIAIHVAENADTCPRLEWNYRDESEIGVCALNARWVCQTVIEVQLVSRYSDGFELEPFEQT